MRKILPSVLGILAVAVVTFFVSVWLTPRVIMHLAIHRIGALGLNAIHFQKRPDEHSRSIVRPSPDLLYSVCPYDLSAGPLRVRSPVPNDTYWSVSLFDDATNNYYVMNDRQARSAGKATVEFFIMPPKPIPFDPSRADQKLPTVRSPSTTGLVLFRALIADDRRLPQIDALRRKATCETVK